MNATNNNQNSQENLKKFAINLCERAREGKLDPVIGRDDEIRRVLQILSRRTKNNPILIGEPGVGKTAIAEGLAHRIVRRELFLEGTSITQLTKEFNRTQGSIRARLKKLGLTE